MTERQIIKKAQKEYVNWVNEKLYDYLITEPDEDLVRCKLYFKKGNEEQFKQCTYNKPNFTVGKHDTSVANVDDIAWEYYTVADIPDPYCKDCGETLDLIDGFKLTDIEVKYCPGCGRRVR